MEIFNHVIQDTEVTGISPLSIILKISMVQPSTQYSFDIYTKSGKINIVSETYQERQKPSLNLDEIEAEEETIRWRIKYCDVYEIIFTKIEHTNAPNLPSYITDLRQRAQKRLVELESRRLTINN